MARGKTSCLEPIQSLPLWFSCYFLEAHCSFPVCICSPHESNYYNFHVKIWLQETNSTVELGLELVSEDMLFFSYRHHFLSFFCRLPLFAASFVLCGEQLCSALPALRNLNRKGKEGEGKGGAIKHRREVGGNFCIIWELGKRKEKIKVLVCCPCRVVPVLTAEGCQPAPAAAPAPHFAKSLVHLCLHLLENGGAGLSQLRYLKPK